MARWHYPRKTVQLALVVTLVAGWSQAANGQAAQNDDERMFRQLDANQDGKLTLDEGGPGSQQMVRRLFEMAGKKEGDAISRQEFARLAEQHRRGTTPRSGAATGGAGKTEAKRDASKSGKMAANKDSSREASEKPARPPRSGRSTKRAGGSGSTSNGLDGVWRGWVVDGRGENPNAGHMQIELRIDGRHIVGREVSGRRSGGDGLGEGDYVMTAAGSSGELDVSGTAGPTQGKEYPGIFELDGDTLKWCVNNRGRGRPRSLETGNGNYLMILRRQ